MIHAIGLALASVLVLGVSSSALAEDLPIAGKWKGTFMNSKGEKGDDSLDLKEGKDGALTGTWGASVVRKGERIGEDTFVWECTEGNGLDHLLVVARLVDGGNTVQLTYRVTHKDAKGPIKKYTGTARMMKTK